MMKRAVVVLSAVVLVVVAATAEADPLVFDKKIGHYKDLSYRALSDEGLSLEQRSWLFGGETVFLSKLLAVNGHRQARDSDHLALILFTAEQGMDLVLCWLWFPRSGVERSSPWRLALGTSPCGRLKSEEPRKKVSTPLGSRGKRHGRDNLPSPSMARSPCPARDNAAGVDEHEPAQLLLPAMQGVGNDLLTLRPRKHLLQWPVQRSGSTRRPA